MEEYISYGAMEKIKNGFYMSSKYESKPIIRNCPHIICFANFEPDYDKLSQDRWKVHNIGVTTPTLTLPCLGTVEKRPQTPTFLKKMEVGDPPERPLFKGGLNQEMIRIEDD